MYVCDTIHAKGNVKPMKKLNILRLFSALTLALAGVLGAANIKSSKEADSVEAALVSKDRIVLELEDQCWATSDSRDPILHMWNISFDSTMEYDANDLMGDFEAANGILDFEVGGANTRKINTDGSIDTGLSWIKEENNKRYWSVNIPWYITGFTFLMNCGSYWGSTERTVTKRGSHMVYTYGSWNSWDNSLAQDTSSKSHTYNVTNYAINATTSGGAPSSTNTAKVKGNGGSFVTSGNYFPRQKISLQATAGTYSSFDSWDYGHDKSSATTYDYVGMAAKTYTAHFADTRSTHTVVFKDYDGSTLETKSNQYQGSSVSITTTPTRSDEGSKVFTFSHWEDASGNDMTSALADLQDDLTVYAVYTISYKAGFYVYGDFGTSPTWSIETAYLLTEFSEQDQGYAWSAKVTIDIPYGSVFKLRYYNTAWYDDQEFDTRNLQNDSRAKYCYDCYRADHALECYAGGRYTIILHNYDGQGKTFYINFEDESRTAEQLAAYLMSFGSSPASGTCGDRFPNARNMFLNQLSGSEKTIFQGYHSDGNMQFRNAYNRYVAWARALGEDPWSSGKANSAAMMIGLNSQTTNTVAILVIISLASVTAIGGYFFIRRRKENN